MLFWVQKHTKIAHPVYLNVTTNKVYFQNKFLFFVFPRLQVIHGLLRIKFYLFLIICNWHLFISYVFNIQVCYIFELRNHNESNCTKKIRCCHLKKLTWPLQGRVAKGNILYPVYTVWTTITDWVGNKFWRLLCHVPTRKPFY
jgi:hypothetical protein